MRKSCRENAFFFLVNSLDSGQNSPSDELSQAHVNTQDLLLLFYSHFFLEVQSLPSDMRKCHQFFSKKFSLSYSSSQIFSIQDHACLAVPSPFTSLCSCYCCCCFFLKQKDTADRLDSAQIGLCHQFYPASSGMSKRQSYSSKDQ